MSQLFTMEALMKKGEKKCLHPCPDWELLVGTDVFYHNIARVTRLGNASQVVVVLEPRKLIAESLYLSPRSLHVAAESEAISVLKN